MNSNNCVIDDGIISTDSNVSVLNSDSLDQLYKEQLEDLRNLAIKTAQQNDIDVCRKWLKVFNRISSSEKMARNCLCALMKEQIQECGGLREPFTNLRNCNRNLEDVLNELDNLSCRTNHIQEFEEACEQQQQLDTNAILQENQDVLLRTEAVEVKNELQSLRMQLTEKEIENVKLRDIAEKFRIKYESYEEKFYVAKKSILENINDLLLEMQKRGLMGIPLKFFQLIFDHFPHKDDEFNDIIGKYDEDLQYVLHNQFKCDFNKRKSMISRYICRKFAKSKAKLREKYERRLKMQNDSHKIQLKLVKLNSFSILRQIFINFHDKFEKLEGWQIMKALEDKYQNIVNGEM